MKPDQIFEALSYVDEDLLLNSENGKNDEGQPNDKITEFQRKPTKKKIYKYRWGALAACACLALVLFSVPMYRMINGGSASLTAAYDENASMDTAKNSDAASNETAQPYGDSDETADEAARSYADSDTTSGESTQAYADSDVAGTVSEAETLWVTSDGYDYEELTEENAADYGLTESELTEIPESDIGDSIGTIESASDESLENGTIYESVNHDGLYIVKTADGYRYFVRT